MKLHGSINWTACGNCPGGVAVHPVGDYIQTLGSLDHGSSIPLRISESLSSFPHSEDCSDSAAASGVPLLVPPTWSKAEHHNQISRVWRHAAHALETARSIIVIGYSLPDTDQFFRYLYALGTMSETRIERFWVIDPDEDDSVAHRFRTLLGPTALGRFSPLKWRFSTALRPPERFPNISGPPAETGPLFKFLHKIGKAR